MQLSTSWSGAPLESVSLGPAQLWRWIVRLVGSSTLKLKGGGQVSKAFSHEDKAKLLIGAL